MNPHTNLFEQRRILAFLREPQTGDMGWTDEEAEKRERAYERLVDLLESLDAHMSSGGTAPDAWITSLAYVGGRGRTPPAEAERQAALPHGLWRVERFRAASRGGHTAPSSFYIVVATSEAEAEARARAYLNLIRPDLNLDSEYLAVALPSLVVEPRDVPLWTMSEKSRKDV
jgi:hypothetical protein